MDKDFAFNFLWLMYCLCMLVLGSYWVGVYYGVYVVGVLFVWFIVDRLANPDSVCFSDRLFALVMIPVVWKDVVLRSEYWGLFRYGDVGDVLAKKIGKKR